MNRNIYIDKRPIALLFLLEYNKVFILLVLFILFLYMLCISPPGTLNIAGWKSLCVFGFCISLWITNAIPRAITGLLAIVLIPALNILPKDISYSLFGNQAIFFILGAFMIAAAYSKSGLSKRLAILILQKVATTPGKLLLTILLFSAALSLCMPEHAVAVLLFPIVTDINKYIEDKEKDRYTTGMLFALVWGCCIGGVGTFLGGARNPLAVSLLEEMTDQSISFFEWIIFIIPFVVMALVFTSFYLTYRFKAKIDLSKIQDKLLENRKWIGKITFKESCVGIIIIFTVLCWILFGDTLGITNIALFSAILLFVLNLISWQDASSSIHWDILLMYGGAISLGSALHKTGAITWLTESYFSSMNIDHVFIVIGIATISMLLTEGISNAAVVILVLPVAINLGFIYGIDPKIMVFCVSVPSGLAFMLPIGNPPNAICYSSGKYSISECIKTGLPLSIITLCIFIVIVLFYWPLIGLKL